MGRDFAVIRKDEVLWDWQGFNSLAGRKYEALSTNLMGAHQQNNSALVLALLPLLEKEGFSVSDEDVRSGLKSVYWPGRLELLTGSSSSYIPQKHFQYLLDGGHNPAGIRALAETLMHSFSDRHIVLVWAAMADKDRANTLPQIAPLVESVIITRPEGDRSAEPADIKASLSDGIAATCLLVPNISEALREAEKLAKRDSLILIAGSLYLVGAVRKILVGEMVEA